MDMLGGYCLLQAVVDGGGINRRLMSRVAGQ